MAPLKKPWLKEYTIHRLNAARRGIGFELTLEEWVHIWTESGHIHERGKEAHQYCMARFKDEGSYRVGNVQIVTARQNALDGDKSRRIAAGPEASAKKSISIKRTLAKTPPEIRRARAARAVATRTAEGWVPASGQPPRKPGRKPKTPPAGG